MLDISSNKDLEFSDDFFLPDMDNKTPKIELDKNLFKGQIFEFFNYLMTDKIQQYPNPGEEYLENEKQLDLKEQIDEIKMNLFFILYHDCSYNENLLPIINQNQEINAKRLIIQNYSINKGIIKFEKKQYVFIPPKTSENSFKFNYDDKEIVIMKKKKDRTMKIKDQIILNSDEFIKKNESIIKNMEDLKEKKKYKTKSVENMPKNKIQISDSSSIQSINKNDTENKTKSEMNIVDESIPTSSEQNDDSEKELRGDIFYDQNARYIFKDDYHKEIDGIFSEHKPIEINKNKIDLISGLNELLSNNYNIENGIRSHIIFKNFEENQINENEPFIIEVKKSMAELNSLLNQIKNISKVVHNIQGVSSAPKYLIGIICGYETKQIELQKKLLNSSYKGEKVLAHIMNIIENNEVKVIIGAIKDEKIFNYPLGKADYHPEIGRETRIDIYYMNSFLKKYDEKKINEIYAQYSKKYKSLSLTRKEKLDYDTLSNNYQESLSQIQILKNENSLLQEKLTESNIELANNIMKYINEKYGIVEDLEEIKKKFIKKND